jgi:hypothetical protein
MEGARQMGIVNPVASDAVVSTVASSSNNKLDTADNSKHSKAEFSANSDAVILDASLGTSIVSNKSDSSSSPSFQELFEALSLTSKEIVDKINEQLKISLPSGIQSLKPEDVTPEATAERIVSGVTVFFDQYAKQNKDLKGDELVDSFIAQVQKGVGQGYDDAFKFLEDIGAFEVDGVKEGIEKTRSLIDEKLAAFSAQKKKDLSPAAAAEVPSKEVVNSPAVSVNAVA